MVSANVKKLFALNLCNNLFWLSAIATLFYVHRGLDYVQILSLGSIMSGVIILLEVPTGVFADRFGRKSALVISSFLLMVGMLVYLVPGGFWVFAFASAITGAGLAFFSGAAEALLYDSLDSQQRNDAAGLLGKFYSAEVLAGVISPPIASVIARDLLPGQFNVLIWLTVVCYVGGLLVAMTLKEVPRDSSYKHQVRKDVRYIWQSPRILRFVVNRALVASAMLSFMFLWQPRLQFFGVPIALFGILLAIGSLGIFIVNRRISVLRSYVGTRILIIGSALVPALSFGMLAAPLSAVIAGILYVVSRVTAAIREPILSELINQEIPSARRATMLSMFSLITSTVTIVLRPVIGAISDVDLRFGFLAIAGLCTAAFLVTPINDHHIQREKQ